MTPSHPAPVLQALLALVAIGALGACAVMRGNEGKGRVRFVDEFDITFSSNLSRGLAKKVAELADVDPEHPLANPAAGQTLSMFGREDLIATNSRNYRPTRCAPLVPATDALDEIERRGRQTSIVIINESHERSEHRGFITAVASRLRPLGYGTLAIETLTNNPPDTPALYAPTFVKQPELAFLEDGDGFYLSEAGFGRLGRHAKALGYRLLPYEFTEWEGQPVDATEDQRIAIREGGQARNLTSFLRRHPGAKILIHVGYGHAAEAPQADGAKWMAARLKEMTGIDPLTISQTNCRGGGATMRLAAAPSDQVARSYDLLVDHPTARFSRGRPAWRWSAGDRPVSIPPALRPATSWRVIEARPEGEPAASVPMDRVAIRPGEDVALMLPPGRYQLRAIDVMRPERSVRQTAR